MLKAEKDSLFSDFTKTLNSDGKIDQLVPILLYPRQKGCHGRRRQRGSGATVQNNRENEKSERERDCPVSFLVKLVGCFSY
jgi:hypothetical protein